MRNKPLFRFSLQWRLVIAFLCLLLVTFILLYMAVTRLIETLLEQQIIAQQALVVDMVARDLDIEFSDRMEVLALNATLIRNTQLAAPDQLQAMILMRPALGLLFNGGVIVVGRNGITLASTPKHLKRSGVSYADLTVVRAALEAAQTTVSEPIIGKMTKSQILTIGTPIQGSDGQPIGALVGIIDLGKANFFDHIGTRGFGTTSDYVLVSRVTRTVVAASDPNLRMHEIKPDPLSDRFLAGFEGHSRLTNTVGQQMIVTAKGLQKMNWYLTMSTSTEEAFAPMVEVEGRLIVGTVALFGLVAVMFFVMVRFLLRPLGIASRAVARQIHLDDLQNPLPVVRDDEIGQLVLGFNRLLTMLAERKTKLQRSELRYYGMLQSLQVGLVVQSSESKIVLSNRRAHELLGLCEAQLLGKTSLDSDWNVIHPDGSPFPGSSHPAVVAAATGKPVHDVVMGVYRPANGDRVWLLVNAEPQFENDDPESARLTEVICTFSDVTQLRQWQERLKASDAFNFAVINSLADNVCVLDKDGYIVAVNLAWSEFGLANRTPNDSGIGIGIGTNYLQICEMATVYQGSSDAQLSMAGIRQVLNGTLSDFHLEYPLETPTQKLWFRMGVTPLRGEQNGAVISHQNITLRKLAEHELTRSQKRLQAILDVTPVPKALLDMKGNFTYFNQSFISTFGYTLDDASTLARWNELALPDTQYREQVASRWAAEVSRSIETGEMTHSQDLNVRCKNGEVKTVLAESRRVLGHDEGIEVLVMYDITSLKVTHALLESSLREKSALLREVHHRVKNNLQVITSLLRLEGRRVHGNEARGVLSEMQGRIRSMALLHESLYRSGVFASVDLANYLRRLATQAFRALATPQQPIQLKLDLQNVSVSLDQATPCGLLLNELISNCLKHAFTSIARGTVTIELYSLALQKVLLRVSDDGIGLPADFAQCNKKSLGMQLVADLALQLGGSLRIGDGPGTQISVEFTVQNIAEEIKNA